MQRVDLDGVLGEALRRKNTIKRLHRACDQTAQRGGRKSERQTECEAVIERKETGPNRKGQPSSNGRKETENTCPQERRQIKKNKRLEGRRGERLLKVEREKSKKHPTKQHPPKKNP